MVLCEGAYSFLRCAAELRSRLLATIAVFTDSNASSNLTVLGYQAQENEDTHVFKNEVGPAYFATMGVPLLAGRLLDARDGANAPLAVLVNRALALRIGKNENDALAEKISLGPERAFSIVGVVADVRQSGLDSAQSWCMAALAFLTCFIVFGVVYSFGAFFVRLARLRQALESIEKPPDRPE